MRKAISAAIEMRWTILSALLFGIALSPFDEGLLTGFYDWARPVVSMQGKIIARDADSVTLHIWGEKNRGCRFINIQGFYQTSGGIRHDTQIQRVDQASLGQTKPAGLYDIGAWRLRPVVGATAVSVYVQHDCGGRVVLTKIAEAAL